MSSSNISTKTLTQQSQLTHTTHHHKLLSYVKNYILCKPAISDPGSKATQAIVRYAHAVLGIDIRPPTIIERMHPPQATQLPTIYDRETGIWHVGYDAVITWYEEALNMPNIVKKANDWAAQNENYRIQRFGRNVVYDG